MINHNPLLWFFIYPLNMSLKAFSQTVHSCLSAMTAIVLFGSIPVHALFAQENDAQEGIRPDQLFGLGWLDRTHAAASEQINAIASNMDRFFGLPRSDLEAAYSTLRITPQIAWNDIDNSDGDLKVRGRIHLPRINERISVIFSDNREDDVNSYDQNDAAVTGQQSTRLNLELNIGQNQVYRTDFRVGMNSSLQGRVSFRYRFEPQSRGSFANRFIQKLYFRDGDGFGSYSRYQVDHILNPDTFIRLTSDVRFEESFDGARWSQTLEFLTRRSQQTALSLYGRVIGETDPGFIPAYDIGFRLRKKISRDWLFAELEPGYTWRKQLPITSRESSPYIILRLEIALGRF